MQSCKHLQNECSEKGCKVDVHDKFDDLTFSHIFRI